ncbi:unnamed protein product [Rhizophagus irregularis]|nr:unnamed protein product [Rhizophagus irregularis]
MNNEFLRANVEYNERRDAENTKLRARIEELESENIEVRDRLTKVEQKQALNDNSSNIRSSNFNSVADQAPTVIHHEKPLVDTLLPEDKETDNPSHILPRVFCSNRPQLRANCLG